MLLSFMTDRSRYLRRSRSATITHDVEMVSLRFPFLHLAFSFVCISGWLAFTDGKQRMAKSSEGYQAYGLGMVMVRTI
jgi:hypothetical protein